MKRTWRFLISAVFLLTAVTLIAESKNPSDYPLRLHIFTNSGPTFYRNRAVDESKGEGRGNVFENGEARAVDFSYDCWQKIRPSFGFETYPAKWKKKNEELTVLFPVFGKANSYFTCNLKTQAKDYAYLMRNGRLESEPVSQFKQWMTNHDYDPEHGKNTPSRGAVSPLEAAKQALTGSNKDTLKAKSLLLGILQNSKAEDDPEAYAWAEIYLGYIEDRDKNREAALGWYQKALAVEGAPPGSLNVAKAGLQRPLVWIRHLDGREDPPAEPSSY